MNIIKNYSLTAMTIVILTPVLIIMFIYFFTDPNYINLLYLSENKSSNVGSTIGGISTPIIGIISIVLLYITLNRQIDSMNKQDKKNEADLIFSLIDQLHLEISYFYHTPNLKLLNTEYKYSGIEAFHRFVQYLNNDANLENQKFSLYSFYQTKQLLLFLRSFNLLEHKIKNNTVLDNYHKKLFLQKLNDIYACLFKSSLEILVQLGERNINLKDDAYYEIVDFIEYH